LKQTLSYAQRLHQGDNFESVLKTKPLSQNWLALHCQPNEQGVARIGIVISKRIVSKATSRNRIKRLIREEFRKQSCQESINFVFRLRKNVLAEEKVEFGITLSSLIAKSMKREK
jgi:ribonuclease P protein component